MLSFKNQELHSSLPSRTIARSNSFGESDEPACLSPLCFDFNPRVMDGRVVRAATCTGARNVKGHDHPHLHWGIQRASRAATALVRRWTVVHYDGAGGRRPWA